MMFSSRLKRKVFIYLLGLFSFILFFQWSATDIHEYTGQVRSEYSYQVKLDLPELNETLHEFLLCHGYEEVNQGVLIETLDSGIQLASLNADSLFNPASTLKLAISLAALEKWGPDHRFRTSFYADGLIDIESSTLYGNLILYSEADPTFRLNILRQAVSKLKQMKIRTVTGDFIIDGPFSINAAYDSEKSAYRARCFLRRKGIYIKGETRFGTKIGNHLFSHYSCPLLDIIWFQNAYSSNPVAERLGDAIGGVDVLTIYLSQKLGIPLDEIIITHSSGLDFNRISPKGMFKILRCIVRWCEENHVALDKIIPIAGVDISTVQKRLIDFRCRGGILAKTGTLLVTDDGVSALAGMISTRKYGIVLFALFNSNGDVFTFQRWQDEFLKRVVERCGGVEPVRMTSYQLNEIYNNTQWD